MFSMLHIEGNHRRLTQRVTLITGGTSGIGEATALLFAKEGAHVVITGRRKELGEEVASRVLAVSTAESHNASVIFIEADHTRPSDCARVVEEVQQKFGHIDVLFNNAGTVPSATAEETTEEMWQQTMDTNVTAVWRMCKLVLPIMRKQQKGVIVNNASDWGIVGGKSAVAYCASKGAVIQMTKAIALDHAREGVRVNAVCPVILMCSDGKMEAIMEINR